MELVFSGKPDYLYYLSKDIFTQDLLLVFPDFYSGAKVTFC